MRYLSTFAALCSVCLTTATFTSQASAATPQFRVGGANTQTRGVVRFNLNQNANAKPTPRFAGRRIGGRGFAGGGFVGGAIAAYPPNNSGIFGDGGYSNLYNQGFIPVPPYFSLHPPVYYNLPVPRNYGYSPFPYPGNTPTPEVQISEPQVINNPYVEPQITPAEELPEQHPEGVFDKATTFRKASTAKVIVNQYVD